jgi:hypothetical protein
MKNKAYQQLAQLVTAYHNCKADPSKADWADKHEENIEKLVKNVMPSGSGFNKGTTLDLDKSTGEKLVFSADFHHMNEAGYYDGWSEHTVTVTASLTHGINLKISGRNRNDIKDYIHDTYHTALTDNVVFHVPSQSYVLERMADLINRPAVK